MNRRGERRRAERPAGRSGPSTATLARHELALTALAEPNRRRIVELLREGPMPVGTIADRAGLRQPQTSKHLKVLGEKGVVEATADANRRIYRLRPEPFVAIDAWLRSFEGVMRQRFDNLDDYLREIQGNEPSSERDD